MSEKINKIIYMDNAATTQLAPEVVKTMLPFFSENYGNASSIHSLGEKAKLELEKAREIIAKKINAEPEEIFFTSGGTESNNLALKGIALDKKKGHIITTKIEHDCILKSAKWLESQGFDITYLNVDKFGNIDPKELEKNIRKDTILVSIIHANNEIGTIQDIKELGKICKKYNIPFHTDACQSLTKVNIDVNKQNLSLVTLNAHKIHGPKGVGALYIKKGIHLQPLQHGGGQEKSIRSGTENIPGIIGFAKSIEIAKQEDIDHMKNLREKLIKGILKIPDTWLNGDSKNRLCNNANISFKYVEGESIAALLNEEGICTSTGSACSSHSLEPSHVLMAIGLKPEEAHGTIRFSISKYTTEEEIEKIIKTTPNIIKKLRDISPLTK